MLFHEKLWTFGSWIKIVQSFDDIICVPVKDMAA